MSTNLFKFIVAIAFWLLCKHIHKSLNTIRLNVAIFFIYIFVHHYDRINKQKNSLKSIWKLMLTSFVHVNALSVSKCSCIWKGQLPHHSNLIYLFLFWVEDFKAIFKLNSIQKLFLNDLWDEVYFVSPISFLLLQKSCYSFWWLVVIFIIKW